MNKFKILNNLRKIEKLDSWRHYDIIKNNIKYVFNSHDTGEGIDIYLIDNDKSLHVYYDYNWFYERYLFNENGKVHGYLVKGPWVEIIENQFKEWEQKLQKYKSDKLLADQLETTRKIAEEQNKIRFFEEKFASI